MNEIGEYLVLTKASWFREVLLPAHALLFEREVGVRRVRLRVRELLQRHLDVLVRQLLRPPLLIHYVHQAPHATVLTVHSDK